MVFAEALVVLEQPAELELAHRLLGGALHGGRRGANNDGIMLEFVADGARWLA
jgi:hypothetical protein